ncbi:STAS/SEC14 domain-containing protein [Aquibacillus halophilus]|uniref:STAS/SEC14 domain-containing protein n=1 Tax=Aquibacillus halophilus TaxID=930132 RepID=A0A6A8DE69_9BACI|nr:STAS/SEC14 domain-containing protein [Aquibacillus halophilus]MRH42139.1 STAS/SEC14 domain-containing protein [Aquibacillus halophilus]
MITLTTNNLESVVEVNVDGKITETDMEEFKEYFKLKKAADGKINLLLVIKEIEGYSMQGLIEDLKFEANHWKDVNKIAVTSDKKWLEIATKIGSYLPKIETKHFDRGQRDQALDWLNS